MTNEPITGAGEAFYKHVFLARREQTTSGDIHVDALAVVEWSPSLEAIFHLDSISEHNLIREHLEPKLTPIQGIRLRLRYSSERPLGGTALCINHRQTLSRSDIETVLNQKSPGDLELFLEEARLDL